MSLTVSELRERLAGLNGDLLVVMSKDGEGNDFSPLADTGVCEWTAMPDAPWYGDIKTPDDEKPQELEDWDPSCNVVNAICLWPVN